MTIDVEPAYESGPDRRYTCSECGYILLDAAYGDVEDHWRAEHSRVESEPMDPALAPIIDDLRALTAAARKPEPS